MRVALGTAAVVLVLVALPAAGQSDLSVTAAPPLCCATAGPHRGVEFSVSVTNNGPSAASNVVLDASVAGVAINALFGQVFLGQQSGPTFSCDHNGMAASRCTIASLASGATATFRVTLSTEDEATPKLATLTAMVSSGTADPNGSNDSATASVTVQPTPDTYTLQSRGCAPSPVAGGGTVTCSYTVGFQFFAPQVIMTYVLPSGATYDPAANPGCTGTTTVTCTTLPFGFEDPGNFSFTLRAPFAPGVQTVQATLTSQRAAINGGSESVTSNFTVSAATPALSTPALLLLLLAIAIVGARSLFS